MSTAENRRAKSPIAALKSNSRGQLSMLIAQLLLGMAVALIGMPSQTSGFSRVASMVLLILHILVAIGLLVGAIRAIPQAAEMEPSPAGLAWSGLVAVVIAFGAGVVTMITPGNWWTYLMAAAASVSLVVYGLLYVKTLR